MAYKFKGQMYASKEDAMAAKDKMKKANKALGKDKAKFGDSLFKKKSKKTPASNVDSGRGGKDSARQKMYDKTSMFAKRADIQDKARTTPGKARSFKDAFDAATKAGKDSFRLEGKSYLTTKGKRKDRFPVTTDKKSAATPKKSLREKLTGFKSQKGFEDARDKRRIEKRIANIKKRKNAGKSFSAKNLSELEAKLK